MMKNLKELTSAEMQEALSEAAERELPLTLTVRIDETWRVLHSRLVARQQGALLVAVPASPVEIGPDIFGAGRTVGVSFKLKHHKHVFSSSALGTRTIRDRQGETVEALALGPPAQMRRLQRRVFARAVVPADRIVRASFWLGGTEAEPSQSSTETPVWVGRVLNISAGGVRVACPQELADALEVGDTVGMHITFGVGQDAVSVDAQVRHAAQEEQRTLLGFQFVGLDQTAAGRRTLQEIGRWTAELARLAGAEAENQQRRR